MAGAVKSFSLYSRGRENRVYIAHILVYHYLDENKFSVVVIYCIP